MSRTQGPDGRFAGRVAVVTGAASGIGAATARRLAREGASVALLDIDPGGEATASRITDEGGVALFERCDVANESDWLAAVDRLRGRLGPVDILVSNAFFRVVAPVHETDPVSWDRQIGVSLTGAFLGARACLPDLVRRHGSIVVVSSVHASFGLPGHPAYAAAKGGLTALTRQLAVEYGPEVRANAILPGPVLTAAWDGIPDEDRQRSIAGTALRRFGEPDEVAAAVAFLASNEASFVTGASLVVDGGWSVSKDSS